MNSEFLEDYRTEASELQLSTNSPLLRTQAKLTQKQFREWCKQNELPIEGVSIPKVLKQSQDIIDQQGVLRLACQDQLPAIDRFIRAAQDPGELTQAELGTLYIDAARANDQLRKGVEHINHLVIKQIQSCNT